MHIDLTVRELAMLDFEREWWRFDARKEDQIRARFDLSPSSYYRVLQALIEMDAAHDYDPLTVKRLRRQRDQRATRPSRRSSGRSRVTVSAPSARTGQNGRMSRQTGGRGNGNTVARGASFAAAKGAGLIGSR